MRLRYVLAAAVLAAVAASARAQVGVYVNPVFNRISNSTPDSGPFAFLGQNSTSRNFGGLDFGGYYDFPRGPGLKFGADVRDTIVHSGNASLNVFSLAARVEAPSIGRGIRPYVQLAAGAGRSKSDESLVHATRGLFGVFAGIDYPLGRHVDFRVVELGYGSVTTINSYIYGGPKPIGASTLVQVSSGLVFRFHLPGGQKKEKNPY
ncbi:MAG TPA: outer membrane beta-barrel protein [Candidatus Aquilonibacter sp.]|nr:outer membrane beta-barrel protein [Candidatus Aquilonibacter sp.]